MPYSYSIRKEERLVISSGFGLVTFAELQASSDQLATDPNFNPDFDQLVDATAMTELRVSVDEAMKLARVNLFSRASRRAFVAPEPAAFGMIRLWSAYYELRNEPSHVAVAVFSDLASALTWLGRDKLEIC